MIRSIFIIVSLFFTFFIQATEKIPYLFLNSSPLKAKIIINGVENDKQTPCLLRDLTDDSNIIIRKEGFKDTRLTKENLNSKNFAANLVPLSFDLYFPDQTVYFINNSEIQGPVYLSKINSGTYEVKLQNNKIHFNETSPVFFPLEIGLGTAFGISFSILSSMIGISEYNNYYAHNSGDAMDVEYYKRTTQNVDVAKYVSIGITTFVGLALMGVIIGDVSVKYSRSKKFNISNKAPTTQDTVFFDNSIKYLSVGDIGKSTQVLQSIIALYPDSDLIPEVYYQLGQNYFINKDYDNALNNWEIFIRDFPVRDYYDYVIKNISDIYYTRNDLVYARNMMERVVYSENIYNKELINSFIAKLDFEIYAKSKNISNFNNAEKEYLSLISDFNNSERLDIYFSQLIKLYNYTSSADKITELKNKAQNLAGVDESIKKMILSYFN
jgi:outer membrane protein assembly factor BamD (BamD/ComL family)